MTIGADIAPSTTEGGTGVAGLSKAVSVVTEGQYNAVGEPATSLSPATITAMVGMKKGEALTISSTVTKAMDALALKAASSDFPANVQANLALANLTTLQSTIFNPADQGGFGAIVGQVQGHIETSHKLINTSNFLSNSSYSDFGTGIKDLGSMGDRGMTNVFGSLPGTGKAMSSFGTMFNGIDVKRFGTPSGLVESLQNNKLANATGLNQKLAAAGVDLNDIHNPVYADKISSVLTNIKDPAAINTTADQFGINNPFAGLPSYTGSDSSLYKTPDFLTGGSAKAPVATTIPTAGTSTFGAPTTTGFPTASGYSTQGGSFGSEQIQGQTGTGIQGLKDLSDYTKTANPADTAGFAGMDSLTSKFKDMGAGRVVDASKASSFFGSIQKVDTPLTNSAHTNLASLMNENIPEIKSLIGSGSGVNGVPNARDFLHSVAGGPIYDDIETNGVTIDNISSLNNAISQSTSLFSTAGITTGTFSANPTLTGVATFASKLPQYGKQAAEGSLGDSLRNMANGASKYGEAVKASMAEGKNNNLLSANGMGPLKTNPFEGLPSQDPAEPNAAAKMMGGGDGPPPTPSRGSAVGYSTDSGAFGSESTKGQVGTGTAGLKGTPFDITGGR